MFISRLRKSRTPTRVGVRRTPLQPKEIPIEVGPKDMVYASRKSEVIPGFWFWEIVTGPFNKDWKS
jgi:hypothetical protein